MFLKPSVIAPVPKATARVAKVAFPKGNLYLSMRENLGTLFEDVDFTDLYPRRGQPAVRPVAAGFNHRAGSFSRTCRIDRRATPSAHELIGNTL